MFIDGVYEDRLAAAFRVAGKAFIVLLEGGTIAEAGLWENSHAIGVVSDYVFWKLHGDTEKRTGDVNSYDGKTYLRIGLSSSAAERIAQDRALIPRDFVRIGICNKSSIEAGLTALGCDLYEAFGSARAVEDEVRETLERYWKGVEELAKHIDDNWFATHEFAVETLSWTEMSIEAEEEQAWILDGPTFPQREVG